MDEIEKKIVDLIAQKAGVQVSEIKHEMKISEIGVPSLDFIELVFDIEDKFDVEIPSAVDFGTLGNFISTVKNLIVERETCAP